MRIFVTGATGVLGRRAVPMLVELGHEVTAVGRTPEKRTALEQAGREGGECRSVRSRRRPPGDRPHGGRLQPGDRGPTRLSKLPALGLAADGPDPPGGLGESRRGRPRGLERAADRPGSFAPIYADAGDAWVDEASPQRPDWYNRSILDAERQMDRLTRAGREGVVLRFGWLYGPDDELTFMLLDGVRRGWFPLLGRAEGYSSWLAHEDGAAAVVAALDVPAGAYNVVEDHPLRRRELGAGIARLVGTKSPRFLPAVGGRARRARWHARWRARSGFPIASFERRRPGNRDIAPSWTDWRTCSPRGKAGWPPPSRRADEDERAA